MKKVTAEMRNTTFRGMNFLEIRNELERRGLDRHMTIELESTEICLITPEGIILQVRSRNEGLGLWGGSLEYGETPIEGAICEMQEETGIILKEGELEYVETYTHCHEYPNKDKALFTTYRYVVRLPEIPEIKLDKESVGYVIIREMIPGILEDEREFIERFLTSC